MLAVLVAARWYGMGWAVNRELWGTRDGWPEFRQFWGWYAAIGAGRAWDRLDIARAVSLTRATGAELQRLVLDERRMTEGK